MRILLYPSTYVVHDVKLFLYTLMLHVHYINSLAHHDHWQYATLLISDSAIIIILFLLQSTKL